MKISILAYQSTPRYPWTHRIEFTEELDSCANYIALNEIPGIWANSAFYTTCDAATHLAMKWYR